MNRPNSSAQQTQDRRRLTRIDRFCRLFTDVRAGEGHTGVLMTATIMLILVAFYMIKPVREGWISMEQLPGLTRLEIKAYANFGQSLIFLFILSTYDKMVGSLTRDQLIRRSTLFCASNLLIFWVLQPRLYYDFVPGVGIIFYLWVGMFGAFMVAQAWAFIIDLYNNERGRRLLPMIAIGATLGSVCGSALVNFITSIDVLGTQALLLLANIPLIGSWLICRSVNIDPRLERIGPGHAPGFNVPVQNYRSAFKLVLGNRLLMLIAVITLLLNWVNSNGENLLFRIINEVIMQDIMTQGVIDADLHATLLKDKIIDFYGDFFFWVNMLALALQTIVTSRLVKYGGLATVLLILPVLVLASNIAIVIAPILTVIQFMKVVENATDYSIHNTARNILWLPMSMEVKFKAKTTIDSLFARLGDGFAAATVLMGVHVFSFSVQDYFFVNVGLVMVWLVGSLLVVQGYNELTGVKASSDGSSQNTASGKVTLTG
ncbi:MAG: hypothetical protein HQL53_05700 [Magnetococcales bacterium]|nr:hypothetical protein [Magnetococcales bacterium]